MLSNVSKSVTYATRQVVLRHPNAFPCEVWRKKVLRTEKDDLGADSTMGGSPTLGGMGVLRTDDETDIEYQELGGARMLLCGVFEPADMNERSDATLQPQLQQTQIVSIAAPDAADYFEVDSGDLIIQDLGLGVLLAYDVATVTGSVNIPPFVRRVVLQPRDDLHALEPFASLL
jgi:hypothetical protein